MRDHDTCSQGNGAPVVLQRSPPCRAKTMRPMFVHTRGRRLHLSSCLALTWEPDGKRLRRQHADTMEPTLKVPSRPGETGLGRLRTSGSAAIFFSGDTTAAPTASCVCGGPPFEHQPRPHLAARPSKRILPRLPPPPKSTQPGLAAGRDLLLRGRLCACLGAVSTGGPPQHKVRKTGPAIR